MLNIVSSSPQSFTAPGDITFDTNRISSNCYIIHDEGSPIVRIKKAGYYLITFNADAAAVGAAEASPIIVQMYKNGVPEEHVLAEALSESNTDDVNLSFITAIKVGYSCPVVHGEVELKFRTIGANATFDNVAVTVVHVR